jgi:hypothetical protein
MSRRILKVLVSLAAATSLLAALGAGQAFAGSAHWSVVTRSAPSILRPEKSGQIVTVIANLGDEPIVATEQNPVVITDALPAGVAASSAMSGETSVGVSGATPTCEKLPVLKCKFIGTVQPYGTIDLFIKVQPGAGFAGGTNEVRVEGAGVVTQPTVQQIPGAESETPFGVERFELGAEEESGGANVTAGSHPFALTTTLQLNQILAKTVKGEFPSDPALLKNLDTTLPPGLIGNPLAVPQCSDVEFSTVLEGNTNACPTNTAVGAALVTFFEPGIAGWKVLPTPIFNLEPALGEPARFGFEFQKVPVTIDTSVLTGNGYAVVAETKNASQAAAVLGAQIVVWGIPNSPSHDNARGWPCLAGGALIASTNLPKGCKHLEDQHPSPYLTMPTYCSQPLVSSVTAQSWDKGAPVLGPYTSTQPALNGCGSLPFNPSLTVTPDQRTASTPTGLTVEVKIPQETTLSANGLAEADVFSTELAFPEGLQANAGAADGLETCSTGQVGFEGLDSETGSQLESTIEHQRFSAAPASCPDASKIGEVDVHSPLLEHDLKGFAYLAAQNTNPFASPLVLYFLAEDPVSGVRLKLAGETRITPTGQLIGVFKNTPPLPAETIKLHLFDGPRATLSTPPLCRPYTSKAVFNTWSGGAPVERTSSFSPEGGPNGTSCQSEGPLPFKPELQTGSVNNHAGAYSAFTLTVRKPDGQQGITGVTTVLPAGLAAKLASVTPCPEPANEVEWNCGPSSQIGVAHASSGLGPDPVNLTGQAYLTTGYDGAPFGLLVRTLAKAGPFNLGYTNVRSRINVNETTAAVTVTTDAGPHHEPGGRAETLPTIFKGVPVQLKAINVEVNRPEFQFNPTNCEPMSIGATLNAGEGGVANYTVPFQVAGCQGLPFAPKFTATVAAQGSKAFGTAATITVESGGIGSEGIRKVFLIVPKILPARLQPTLQNACLDKVFVVNPAGCPEDSFIGKATVTTPVLKNPLVGPAILVSHGNAAFPDVEFVLQGEGIKVLLDGKTDIKKGITYSRFESAPDAPFTKFVTELPAGPHSIFTPNTEIVPNYNVCGQNILAPTEITAQDGRVFKQETQFVPVGCGPPVVVHVTKLEKELKACRKKYKHNKAKRVKCEKAARARNSTKHSKKHSKKHAKRH